jgi:hypothetical protein
MTTSAISLRAAGCCIETLLHPAANPTNKITMLPKAERLQAI